MTPLDVIYFSVDELCHAGEFEKLDKMIGMVSVNDQSEDQLLAWLTATLPAKSKLPNRAAFYDKVRIVLTRINGDQVHEVMKGLE